MIMKFACLCLCVFLIFAGLTYATRRYRERRLEDGAGINFPRRVLSKQQAEKYIFNRKLYLIYRMSNPKPDFEDFKNFELLLEPHQNGSYNANFVARVTEDEVCTSFDWLYEPIPEERDRAVYTFAGPYLNTGEGTTIAHFSRNPDNYVFMLHCLDRTKEIVRNGKRVYCDGPYDILFFTPDFPPDRVKWCEAETELMKTFGVTFDNEFWLFNPILERCSS